MMRGRDLRICRCPIIMRLGWIRFIVAVSLEIPRAHLVSAVLDRPEPIVVVQAGAGMGKSMLLRQIAARCGADLHNASSPAFLGKRVVSMVWDVPVSADIVELDEQFLSKDNRLVIALRPGQSVRGLSRATAYGKTFHLNKDQLLFGADELACKFGKSQARRMAEMTGGWPVLIPHFAQGWPSKELLESFLAEDVLPSLSAESLVVLEELLAGRDLSASERVEFSQLLTCGGKESARLLAILEGPLARAHHRVVAKQGADAENASRMADAYLRHGLTTRAICMLQQAGLYDWALDIFTAEKGFFYIYRHGTDEFDAVLGGFPEGFGRQHETIMLALCLQALKHGDIGRARRLLTDLVGAVSSNPATMLTSAAVHSRQVRLFRLLMVIYEDMPISDVLMGHAFALLDEFPSDAHLERGSFYNAILEFYMRSRRNAEAEDVAARSYKHYVAARVPILCFYINLHRAMMRLTAGDMVKAARYVHCADNDLKAARFESPGDGRLLALLRACLAFEEGMPAPLIHFLDTEFDQFSHGEIWPTILELALQYGAQALGEQFSPAAARAFLERWRIHRMQSHQFQAMIDILEVINLQNGNRWQEAADRLSNLNSPVDRNFVHGARSELTRLDDRDQIALALAWLRHFVFEEPTREGLDVQLMSMIDNLHLMGRQRAGVEVWLAYVHKRNRNLTKARVLLQKTLEGAARQGALAPLAAEKVFLTELVEDQRIAQFLSTSDLARQILRRLSRLGVAASALGGPTGLSRRETKVLLMIAEGGSNKFIAHALGLSEATVKFHLSNVYRKLGCRKRREAIIAARSLGLVS